MPLRQNATQSWSSRIAVLFLALLASTTSAFAPLINSQNSCSLAQLYSHSHTSEEQPPEQSTDAPTPTRRHILASLTAAATAPLASFSASGAESSSSSVYKAAKRPTAYRVDSTTPPTLIALPTAVEQTKMLRELALGSGTDKDAIVVDTVNLNNILNKAVFGTAAAIKSQFTVDDSNTGPGYASFVCLGVPKETSETDVSLATSLLTTMIQARPKNANSNNNMAVGLHWAPLSTQEALNQYTKDRQFDALKSAMTNAGVDGAVVDLYRPLMEQNLASLPTLDFLALSPELEDLKTAQSQGLQQVNPDRRAQYVVDAQGFIGFTQQPQFQMYTDRSLFKDLPPKGNVKPGDFFAMSILKHEAAATACAQYAKTHSTTSNNSASTPLVVSLAPIADVRFLVGGINGRLPRVCNFLGLDKVTEDAVTTILCNPTAEETLSQSRYLRLEIGTGPETLQYQSKVADYLWFSSSPKVNLIPRLMDN